MNATIARALLLDAFHQVVDNKIFRALMLLVGFFVLASFLIGFREQQIEVLFGTWTLTYSELFGFFGSEIPVGVDVQGTAIQAIQAGLVEGLCGSLGMTVCLAATAFFVPRLLEKGAADIVFAKPVSRWALLFSRYIAGLLFVGLLSGMLIGGVWLGILVASGYGDPGFLWGILTLLYLFSMLHAFSLAVGVFTRSTVAALLVSVLFFFLGGCVHSGWRFMEFAGDPHVAQRMHAASDPGSAEVEARAEVDEPEDEGKENGFVHALRLTLDVLHYTLPKTSDADVLTAKLRKALESTRSALQDPVAHVTLDPRTAKLERVAPSADAKEIDLSTTAAVWSEHDAGGAEIARFEVSRRSRELPAENGKRPRRLTTTQATKEILKRLAKPAGSVRVEDASVDGSYAQALRWEEDGRWHSIHVLTFAESLIEITSFVPAETAPRSAGTETPRVASFLGGIKLARSNEFQSPSEWYKRRFTLDAPLKFNVLFSVGSTLAFTLLMLLLAWWKLRRIDF